MARLSLYAPLGIGAALAGQVWLAALAPSLTHETAVSLAAVLPVILTLSLSTVAVLLTIRHIARADRGWAALAVMIAAGLGMRLVWFGSPAPIEDDYYRYLWDGALSRTASTRMTLHRALFLPPSKMAGSPPRLPPSPLTAGKPCSASIFRI